MKKVILSILCVLLCLCLCSCGVCENCEGTNKEECGYCVNGEVRCSEEYCKDGEIPFCNICSPKNSVAEFDACSYCDGSGKEKVACDTCDGNGYIRNPLTWEKFECGRCAGSSEKEISCDKCNGVGYKCAGAKISACTGRCYYIDCNSCNYGKKTCPYCLGGKEQPCKVCCAEAYESFVSAGSENIDALEIIEKTETVLSGVAVQFEQGPNMGLQNIEITTEILNNAKEIITEVANNNAKAKALLDEIVIAEKFVNTSWEMVSGDTQALYDAPDEIKKIDMTLKYDKVNHHFAITLFIYNTSGGGSSALADMYYLVNTDEELMHNDYSGKTVTEQNGNLIIKDTGDGKYIELKKMN